MKAGIKRMKKKGAQWNRERCNMRARGRGKGRGREGGGWRDRGGGGGGARSSGMQGAHRQWGEQ